MPIHLVEQALNRFGARLEATLSHNRRHAILTEHLSFGVLGLEHTVGNQAQGVARGQVNDLRLLRRGRGEEAQRETGRADPSELVSRCAKVHQGSLARRVIPHPVLLEVEQTHERGDEAIVAEIVAELVIQVPMHIAKSGLQPRGQPKHGTNLRHAQCRADTVPRGIGQESHQATVSPRDEVEGVASSFLCGAADPGHVVAGHGRHLSRQRTQLNLARDGDLTLQPRFHQAVPVILRIANRQRCEVRELSQEQPVSRVQPPTPRAVDLQDPDTLARFVPKWK